MAKKTKTELKKTKKRLKGDIGEEIACKYLVNKGYFVKERNYWKPWGEIDIVAFSGKTLKFVEVKTASYSSLEHVSREMFYNVPRVTNNNDVTREPIRPEENFHKAKLERLHRVIQTYLSDNKVPTDTHWEIDLACVYLDETNKKAKVELFDNLTM